ncbi:TetR/AcrR family transcriptional regulator [Dactylosporangium sp. CS-033363]|uniref:TetR/AcrR family transcriptional regulator n=1 Tax=Dactylosporangium sp. CS-033363 TaxID=3239935 RepID=UPI003D93AE03
MGRPARHDSGSLLDAAVRLVVAGGPKALTMAAVAREAGGPSGSVYHRFAGRPALAAALWLRTVERFQDGFLAALAEGRPAHAARRGPRRARCDEHAGLRRDPGARRRLRQGGPRPDRPAQSGQSGQSAGFEGAVGGAELPHRREDSETCL